MRDDVSDHRLLLGAVESHEEIHVVRAVGVGPVGDDLGEVVELDRPRVHVVERIRPVGRDAPQRGRSRHQRPVQVCGDVGLCIADLLLVGAALGGGEGKRSAERLGDGFG
ncbi:hypothetical protein [Streptomyces sirii]|uniref:hypothetical protein n=1 Tax=Streptomyces sirii TaxID=3127701 RepID=UPI003D3655BE